MKSLENKIPPPVILLLALIIIWLLQPYDQVISLPAMGSKVVGWAVIAAGLLIAFSAAASFKKAATTVNPLKPDTASNLVISGVFKVTRNPMYLGMVMVCVGSSVIQSSALGLLVSLGVALYLTRFQILPEEKAMLKLFGEQFVDYKAKVPRWLIW